MCDTPGYVFGRRQQPHRGGRRGKAIPKRVPRDEVVVECSVRPGFKPRCHLKLEERSLGEQKSCSIFESMRRTSEGKMHLNINTAVG